MAVYSTGIDVNRFMLRLLGAPMPPAATWAQQAAQPSQVVNPMATMKSSGGGMVTAAAPAVAGAAGAAGLGGLAALAPVLGPVLGSAALVGGTLAGVAGSMANNRVQRQNNARIDELERRKAQGTLGLNPVQQRALTSRLTSPVARAATAGRLDTERRLATMQGASAGDFAAAQAQQTAVNAAAAQQAAQQVAMAQQAAVERQKEELEQRIQAQAQMRADDTSQILGALMQSASAGGALAGSGPGVLPGTLLGLGGRPVVANQGMQGLTPDQMTLLAQLQASGDLGSIVDQAAALKRQRGM